MKIAVTGASGFVGSRLIVALLEEGAEVLALSRRESSDMTVSDRRLSWLALDLENETLDLRSALGGVDCIVHLAAYIPRDLTDVSDADHCLEINASGTLRMLVAAERAKVGRFIYASAGQYYPWSETPATEEDPTYPSTRATFYLVSKLVGEIYVEHFNRSGYMDTVSLRIGSVYGPGMPVTSTMHRLIETVMTEGTIQVQNQGSYSVDLVYVDDVAYLICRVIQSKVTGIYNVGSGKATTFAELVEEIVRQCPGCSPVMSHVSTPRIPGYRALDITKARSDLGFEPLNLEQGLSRTIAQYVRSG
jgi:UDP-glucose 4-epimerase